MVARALLLAAITAAALAIACCTPAAAADPPVPPAPSSYVTDLPGVLSDSVRATLENELRSYEQSTGHRVIVWIGAGTAPTGDWTVTAMQHWTGGKSDAAGLFLFPRDRRVIVEVGGALNGNLTDAAARAIIDGEILPGIKRGDVDAAAEAGVSGMLHAIEHPPVRVLTDAAPAFAKEDYFFLLLALAGVTLGVVDAIRGSPDGGLLGSAKSGDGLDLPSDCDDFSGGGASAGW